METVLIAIVIMVGTAFLVVNAKSKKTIESYVLVLIGGLLTIGISGPADGVISFAVTIVGLGFVVWSIMRMVKRKKKTL